MSDNDYIACSIATLPDDVLLDAARNAISLNPANEPMVVAAGIATDLELPVEHLAALTSKFWGPKGVELTVAFLDTTPQDLQERILSHMNAWSDVANVRFVLTTGDAQVRITREKVNGGGYWSNLGTDILLVEPDQPTMDLQDFTMQQPESEFRRVVRHETGHTLGFPHEHRRKDIVDRIDRNKAIVFFEKTQDWSEQKIIQQVLTPLNEADLQGTPADVRSIMCYRLPAAIMKDGVAVPGGTDIDDNDATFAGLLYPRVVVPTG